MTILSPTQPAKLIHVAGIAKLRAHRKLQDKTPNYIRVIKLLQTVV